MVRRYPELAPTISLLVVEAVKLVKVVNLIQLLTVLAAVIVLKVVVSAKEVELGMVGVGVAMVGSYPEPAVCLVFCGSLTRYRQVNRILYEGKLAL